MTKTYQDIFIHETSFLDENVAIGKFAFIGAGAVISMDVPDYALMVGVPCKQIGWMSEYGEKLDLPVTGNAITKCKHTNQIYELKEDKVILKV